MKLPIFTFMARYLCASILLNKDQNMLSLRIVGSGLIGTSFALALKGKGYKLQMHDIDPNVARLANDLISGERLEKVDLVVFAIPSSALKMVINDEYQLNPNSTFMDVGSVKVEPIRKVEMSALPLERFVATHPMAGREVGGVESARGDLFQGRPWIISPSPQNSPDALQLVRAVIEDTGARVVELAPLEHDRAVALISHLPQLISSLVASQLVDKPQEWIDLAGQGLRDMVRIAASDPLLWREIIYSNRGEISQLLSDFKADLDHLITCLEEKEAIGEKVARGRRGVARIPGKHGGIARAYTYLPIVIDDKPGQLGALFNECAAMEVNVEDLSLEHSPGALRALITLALSEQDAQTLSAHLISIGWSVHPARN